MKTFFLVVTAALTWPSLLLAQGYDSNAVNATPPAVAPGTPDDVAVRMKRLEEETQALRVELQQLREQPTVHSARLTQPRLEWQCPKACRKLCRNRPKVCRSKRRSRGQLKKAVTSNALRWTSSARK